LSHAAAATFFPLGYQSAGRYDVAKWASHAHLFWSASDVDGQQNPQEQDHSDIV